MQRTREGDDRRINRLIFGVVVIVVFGNQRVVHHQRNIRLGSGNARNHGRERNAELLGKTRRIEGDLVRGFACLVERQQVFRIVAARRGIGQLDRPTEVLVGHVGMAVLVLHVVGAEAARGAVDREIGHTQQRRHRLAAQGRMVHAAVFPQRLEVLREDDAVGRPTHCLRIARTALQIARTAAVVGLRNGVVAQFGDAHVEPVDVAVDEEQTAGARLGTDVLAQLLAELLEQTRRRVERAEVVGGRLEVDVDAVVLVLVHRVLAPSLSVGHERLVGDLPVDLELLGNVFGRDAEDHLRAQHLLHERLVPRSARGSGCATGSRAR